MGRLSTIQARHWRVTEAMIGLCMGVPKMGKTQALLDYVGAHAHSHRFFVVDRANDWAFDGGRWRGTQFHWWSSDILSLLGVAVNRKGRAWYADAPPPDAAHLQQWLAGLPDTGVFRFGWPWEGSAVAQLVKDVGSTTYVDDEIDFVALTGGWGTNPLRDFCHRGRHLPNLEGKIGEVHILGAARRPQSMHIDVTTLADWVMVFRVKGHRTWQRLVDDHILEEEEVEEVEHLEPYRYKLWSASGESSWGKLSPL